MFLNAKAEIQTRFYQAISGKQPARLEAACAKLDEIAQLHDSFQRSHYHSESDQRRNLGEVIATECVNLLATVGEDYRTLQAHRDAILQNYGAPLPGTHAASGLRSSVNQIDASSFPTTAADESAIEHPKEGDARLLGNQHAVNFRAAELYLGITPRGRQKAIKAGKLAVVGERGRRRITVESLKRYLPPCRCAICCPQDNAN